MRHPSFYGTPSAILPSKQRQKDLCFLVPVAASLFQSIPPSPVLLRVQVLLLSENTVCLQTWHRYLHHSNSNNDKLCFKKKHQLSKTSKNLKMLYSSKSNWKKKNPTGQCIYLRSSSMNPAVPTHPHQTQLATWLRNNQLLTDCIWSHSIFSQAHLCVLV